MTADERMREQKAHAIADVVDAATREFGDDVVALLRRVDEDVRAAAAGMAGRRAPSDETWQRVVAIVEQRRAGVRLIAEALSESFDAVRARVTP